MYRMLLDLFAIYHGKCGNFIVNALDGWTSELGSIVVILAYIPLSKKISIVCLTEEYIFTVH